jgi:hypothetical protein
MEQITSVRLESVGWVEQDWPVRWQQGAWGTVRQRYHFTWFHYILGARLVSALPPKKYTRFVSESWLLAELLTFILCLQYTAHTFHMPFPL